jgi:hypothetical protein
MPTDVHTNPTRALDELRKLAHDILTVEKLEKPKAVMLARMFQDLDAHLVQGGDAPKYWTSDKDEE